MKLGMVFSHTEPETVFNGLRLANYALFEKDEVTIFLLGKGVELDQIEDPQFDVRGQAEKFLEDGGEIKACGTCLNLRKKDSNELCPLSTLKDLYDLVKESDKVVTF